MLDRQHGGQSGRAAKMIRVVMRDDHVIELPQTGFARDDLYDAVRIAMAGVAGINEHRLPGRRDDQGGRASFDVDPIDVEVLVDWSGTCQLRDRSQAKHTKANGSRNQM